MVNRWYIKRRRDSATPKRGIRRRAVGPPAGATRRLGGDLIAKSRQDASYMGKDFSATT